MSNKKFKELKNLSKDEMASRIRDNGANLFKAKMQQKTGQLKDTASLTRMRKEIARLKTLQTQQATKR